MTGAPPTRRPAPSGLLRLRGGLRRSKQLIEGVAEIRLDDVHLGGADRNGLPEIVAHQGIAIRRRHCIQPMQTRPQPKPAGSQPPPANRRRAVRRPRSAAARSRPRWSRPARRRRAGVGGYRRRLRAGHRDRRTAPGLWHPPCPAVARRGRYGAAGRKLDFAARTRSGASHAYGLASFAVWLQRMARTITALARRLPSCWSMIWRCTDREVLGRLVPAMKTTASCNSRFSLDSSAVRPERRSSVPARSSQRHRA